MDMWDSLVRMVSSLAVVLGLMVAAALVARRFLTTRALGVGASPAVQVVGSGYIGPRKSIVVVAVGGELLIVGTTATHLIPLGRIEDPEQVQRLLPKPSGHSGLPGEPMRVADVGRSGRG